MYQIDFYRSASDFMDKHPELFNRLNKALWVIEQDPYPSAQTPIDIKYLKRNNSEHVRLRIGKYRFLYEIIESEKRIQIYDAGSRGQIYK